ncbi:MAG: peptide chain release factor N(5)-glutamine methyltransferase [Oscillospiraceae bacterium]|nr:peptide chain release factor N(5)-glutamine methyltransferase [Oscillospiraceae bacterium]
MEFIRKNEKIQEILTNAGIENATQEARWICEYGKGDLLKLANRRASGEPLQYLLGEWEFYGYPIKVGEGVLIPRPETELLVDLAKEALTPYSEKYTVLDLCAGSGCVGIAIAHEMEKIKALGCNVISVEKSPQAFQYLKANIQLNGLENQIQAIQADVLEMQFNQKADCILINPPYLTKNEMLTLQKEVTHEPESALYGGSEDGLNFYHRFFAKWSDIIKKTRLFACEVGDNQAENVVQILKEIGMSSKVRKDLSGVARIVYTNI